MTPASRRLFLRWTFLRAVFHRGYVLASGLYFVVTAHLSAAQLVLLGAVMALTLLLSDIPAGVWSDAFSRKWPLVIGHGFLAAGMMLTGAVTTFGWLLVTQVLWGLGWAFSSGADVAWLTDELGQPGRIDRTLTARARWELTGGATGMIAFGVLGWAAGLGAAIVASGAGMALLGAFVAARFGEDNFTPVRQHRWSASLSIFRRGLTLARRDRGVLVMLIATMLLNGAGVITWLFPRQLVNLGFPGELVLWYTALCVLSFAAGVVALRIVEARIDGAGAARRSYVLACFIGVLGLIVLAYAPDARRGRRRGPAGAGDLVQRHPGGKRDLGEPAHHERCADDHALLPVPGRIRRRDRRWIRARRPGPGRRDLRDAAHLGRARRGDRRPGRPVAGWCAIGVSPAAQVRPAAVRAAGPAEA